MLFALQPSLSRAIINVHSAVLVALIGVGFPLFSFFKIRALRNAGKLDFDEGFANLYQFYNPRLPYFESFQFLRKGALIFLLTLLRENPAVQALLSLGINGAFLLLLLCTKPFVYFPSSMLGMNLYQMAEVSSCLFCLTGNALGLVGALEISYVDVLGHVLALMNIVYVVLFVCAYGMEMQRAMDLAETRSESDGREKLVKAELGKEVKEALGEWNFLMASLTEVSPERRQDLRDEMVSVEEAYYFCGLSQFANSEPSTQINPTQ